MSAVELQGRRIVVRSPRDGEDAPSDLSGVGLALYCVGCNDAVCTTDDGWLAQHEAHAPLWLCYEAAPDEFVMNETVTFPSTVMQ